jgi:hypothetical protein
LSHFGRLPFWLTPDDIADGLLRNARLSRDLTLALPLRRPPRDLGVPLALALRAGLLGQALRCAIAAVQDALHRINVVRLGHAIDSIEGARINGLPMAGASTRQTIRKN